MKKMINGCHTCKVFSTKPYGKTSPLPHFRTEASKPFHTTGIDFAGPSSPVQLRELFISKSQTAEKFRDKLNAFISRKTRPQRIVSDNAAVFKTTAQWIKKIRKCEELQDFMAKQRITLQFNLAKSPWWGGMYERIIN